ncbi:glycosyltransferase family 2 protein [Methyloligella solikamskensis]|uniref:Glycosyltransferase family 2 protein n=1 Tax=Methyloligella solikamskensis TaxID=1177756 RepID=A0ABW3JB43_9HYPH
MISAVIPAYNRARTIGRAIDSIVAQTRAVDEILIVDDASTDDLAAALEPYDETVRLVRHEKNRGASAARNTGIAEAKGDMIAFLDSDDVWTPEKIARQMDFMAEAEVSASCTNFKVIPPGEESGKPAWRPYDEILDLTDLVWGCYVSPGSTLLCRRSVLQKVSGYDVSFPRYEDWDLLVRMVRQEGKIGFLNEPLATVYLGTHLSPEAAEGGLERMEAKHWNELAGDGFGSRFQSALAFNLASVRRLEGDYGSMLLELARCYWLYPIGNWPLRVILRDRFRRR